MKQGSTVVHTIQHDFIIKVIALCAFKEKIITEIEGGVCP